MTSDVKDKYQLSPGLEWLAFGILALTALLIRINHLSADPPMDLSSSQSVFTDPAQYISYARNLVLWGSFNPLHDFRLIFFLKSTATLISYLVFTLFGVGYAQANMVGLIFSFPTIILMYFILRRVAGSLSALFFLILISLDYNQIFYGRLSFLENSLNFFAVLSLCTLVYSKRIYALILSGLFLGLGIFFGKVIGLIYIFPFACFGAWEYFHSYSENRKQYILRYISFSAGFLLILIVWYFVSYRPMTAAVEGYLQEQAFALYGAPEAFNSFNMFVYKYVSFGITSRLFGRMIVPALLALGMILIFAFRAGQKKARQNHPFGITPGIVFLIALVIGAYGSLMIWNYRPLRYQTMMIYPIYALAGVFLATLIQNKKTGPERGGLYPVMITFFVLALVPIYQFLKPIYLWQGIPFHFNETRTVLLSITLIITAGVFLSLHYASRSKLSSPRWLKSIFILIAVILSTIPNAAKYMRWDSSATFSTVANSRDLMTIVSPEAVISGPYAADFTQENRLRNLIHMFGVANIDSSFFRRYPVTHLLLDKSNEKKASEDYPNIMEKAVKLFKYRVGGRDIWLYRVAGITGNIDARQYHLSAFETALYYFEQDNIADGNKLMKIHLLESPDNLSANLTTAIIANNNEYHEDAEYYFKKAIEFSPTDFYLRFKLGEFYIGMYKRTSNDEIKKEAIAQFDLARKYNKASKKLRKEIKKLLPEYGS